MSAAVLSGIFSNSETFLYDFFIFNAFNQLDFLHQIFLLEVGKFVCFHLTFVNLSH